MPSYEQKQTLIIVKDSNGNLVQIMPETAAANVLYGSTTAASALQDLEDADVEQGFSEVESQTASVTVQKTTRHLINNLEGNPFLHFGYSYESHGATNYGIDDRSAFEEFIEGGVEWSDEIELDESNKTYEAIYFGISGTQVDVDDDGNETVIDSTAAYSVSSDANENGYAPWSSAVIPNSSITSFFVVASLPAENETKSWLCNMRVSGDSLVSIPLAERNMTFSLTGLGNSRYSVSFLWNNPTDVVSVQETRNLKKLKTSLVRADESVTAVSKPMSGLVQGIAGEAESRIVYTTTYPVDSSTSNSMSGSILIGDSEGTLFTIH